MTEHDPAWGEARSKTVTWFDPAVYAQHAATRSGLELLQDMASGVLPPPPIMQLIGGVEEMTVAPGEITLTTRPDETAYNPIGMVHGGYLTTLLDTVAACAVHTTLPAGIGYTSAEIKVSFLRPVQAGMVLTARGRVIKPGRRMAFAEADLRTADGTLVATASTTCLVLG